MLCPNCETENNDDARLCVECGFPLKGAVSRGAGAASPSRMSASYQRAQRQSSLETEASYDAYEDARQTAAPSYQTETAPSSASNSQPNRSSFDYAREAHDFSWDVPVNEEEPARSLFEPTSASKLGQQPSQTRQAMPQARQAPPQTRPVTQQQTPHYEAAASQTIAFDDINDDLVSFEYAPAQERESEQSSPYTPAQAEAYEAQTYQPETYEQEPYEPQAYEAQIYGSDIYEPEPYESSAHYEPRYAQQNAYAQQGYESYGYAPSGNQGAPGYGAQQQRDMSGFERPGEYVIEEEYYEEVVDDPFEDAYEETYEEDGTYLADTIDFNQQPYSPSSTGPMQSFAADEPPSVVASRGRNFRITQKKKGLKGGQKALLIGGIVVIVAAIIAVVGFALGLWGGVAIPNVVGMTQENAEQALRDAGFAPTSQQVPSDDIEGRVIGTNPKVGTLVEEGSTVTVQVAMARTIPQVVGLTQDEAQKLFDESGYTNVKVVYERSNDEEGIVLSVTPAAGTRAKSGMEITLAVSQSYTVPDVAGMSMDEAYQAVQDAELIPTIMYADTDQYPDGSVIGSDPAAGTKVREGSYVAITVARKRGVELTNLAREYLSSGNTVTIKDVSYQVESIDALSYQGNETVSFTVQAKPFVEIFGETLFASTLQTVTGSIVYNENNEVIGIY